MERSSLAVARESSRERFKRRKLLFVSWSFILNNLFTIPFSLKDGDPQFYLSWYLIMLYIFPGIFSAFRLISQRSQSRRHNSPRQLNAHSHLDYHDTTLFCLSIWGSGVEETEYKSSKYHPAIRSSSHVRKDRILKEPQNYRIQKHAWIWTALTTYIRMNSHICHWSPSFRVAINWRRREINREPEVN